jgi:hypothetical protein
MQVDVVNIKKAETAAKAAAAAAAAKVHKPVIVQPAAAEVKEHGHKYEEDEEAGAY